MSSTFTVAVVVSAHRGPDQVATLLTALRHPQIHVYLHVDRRVDLGPFTTALRSGGTERVTLLERYETPWGAAGTIDAQLAGLRRALADGCRYFVHISGQDLPLESPDRLVRRFEAAPDRSYLYRFPLPDARWAYDGRMRTDFYTFSVMGRRETYIPRGEARQLSVRGRLLNGILGLRAALLPRRRFPPYLAPFGGWTWWNLSHAAARFALGFADAHPDYRAYHEHTLSADELFFPSILCGTGFAEEHEIVNDCLRYMDWPERTSHPRTLGTGDVPAMLASGKPFARKFDLGTDPGVVDALRGTPGMGTEGV